MQAEPQFAGGNGAPNRTTEDTGLALRETATSELAPTGAAAEKQFEIQSAIVIARRFPRNEDEAFAKLMKACSRTTFAEDASYNFPRGGQNVDGPSVNLAREAARVWGNIRYGVDVIRDDEGSRQIRGWAWDLETNVKVTAEDDFQKLVYRKKGGWVRPDERDLRELTNRRGAILVRNCILQLLPKDLIEDARTTCGETLKSEAKKNPDSARKRIITAFQQINVSPLMLEQHLGHALSACSPDEITRLREIFVSIRDGNSTWAEYVEPKAATGEAGGVSKLDDFAGGAAASSAEAQTPAPTLAPEPVQQATDGPQLLHPDKVSTLRSQAERNGLDADHLAGEICGSSLSGMPASFEMSFLREVERRGKKSRKG